MPLVFSPLLCVEFGLATKKGDHVEEGFDRGFVIKRGCPVSEVDALNTRSTTGLCIESAVTDANGVLRAAT